MLNSPTGGGLAALTAALLWAIASTWFSRLGRFIRPVEINILKGGIALVLLTATLYLSGGVLSAIPAQALWLLLLSGAVGIALGDTAFLETLQNLGPRRTLLLTTLSPPMVAVLAWIFLGEALAWSAWVGIFVTVAGIAWVISERTAGVLSTGNLKRGLIAGGIYALAQSSALVLSRFALTRTSVDSLQSAILRLFAGVVFLAIWLAITRRPLISLTTFKQSPHLWGLLASATLVGTYLAIWLQQISVALAPAGIVQTLLSTSPIFILPIAALSGEKLSLRAVLGALVALLGVWLLFGVN
jgi:drug/metabolite transporter (DMT)-like permease